MNPQKTYFSERNGIKKDKIFTNTISSRVYLALLDVCKKYFDNLTFEFPLVCHDNFTDNDYQRFDFEAFCRRMRLKFPKLFNSLGLFQKTIKTDEISQYTFLDFIEYVAQNIKDISQVWNHPVYKNYCNIECKETSNVFYLFQEEINELFEDAGLLFKLNNKKEIERVLENSPISDDVINHVSEIKEIGLKDLINEAIKKHLSPKIQDNKDAVEKIWDALERLKTYYTDLDKKGSTAKIVNNIANGNETNFILFDTEFKTLTDIGNKYRIRHHETDKMDITDLRHYDYFFNRCLSLIALSIQYLT